jgi:hypothetical protein
MKYLFSDFYMLVGAADKETRTVGDAYRRMAELMGLPVTPACLLFSLEGLSAGGYVTLDPAPQGGVITASTSLSVTDAGRKAAVVTGLQKFFGEEKAFNKNELRFCGQERPASVPNNGDVWTVDADAFAEITDGMLLRREIALPLLALTDGGEGQLTLTLRHPDCGYSAYGSEGEDEDGAPVSDPDCAQPTDAVSVTGDASRILPCVSDLLGAVEGLLTDSRTRKVALHGGDRSYVVTLAHAASEYGTMLRMTVEPIRFNRQRFYGKRDGDLDYAQCGAPAITAELNGARDLAARLLPCAVAQPHLLSAENLASIEAIHRRLK